jgi:uncharacterized membrane protein
LWRAHLSLECPHGAPENLKNRKPQVPSRRPPRVVRIVKLRPRLFISAAVGLAAIGVLFIVCGDWRAATKLLIGWDVAVALYLVLGLEMVVRSDMSHIRSRASMQDEGAIALLLRPRCRRDCESVAIFAELALRRVRRTTAGMRRLRSRPSCCRGHSSTSCSRCTTRINDYYRQRKSRQRPDLSRATTSRTIGISFISPSSVGMTFQVSDVQVSNRLIRRLVVTHGALSFVFNTAILAVSVNLATSAIS